ncbi:hypothetical protein [Halorussus ruber]|uniref:hypothetical protein n=1 Tax=Halorussus ruber TaxID=1126238 RepID=UPI0010924FC1|nr:hypothetical protein [Halorussus ruber]
MAGSDDSLDADASDSPGADTDNSPGANTADSPGADLTDEEVQALHEVELGIEWLHRAHGHLVEFHHATGHAMDHLADAEECLRECGHDGLADRLRDDLLPRGVVGDTWSYSVLEAFQDGPLDSAIAFEMEAREDLADGERHVAERRQEREWKGRSER